MNLFLQDFVNRLLKAASRIFGDSQAGIPFVTQLAYENTNAGYHDTVHPYKAQTNLAGYIHLCAQIGSSYNESLAPLCKEPLCKQCLHRNEGIKYVLNVEV